MSGIIGGVSRHPTTSVAVRSVRPGRGGVSTVGRPDVVATEEPMEIRVAGRGEPPESVAVTMRTPTADFELAVGFLFGEGLIEPSDIQEVRYCDLPEDAEQQYNIVTVRLRRPWEGSSVPARAFAIGSSCGLCGKTSLDDVAQRCPVVGGDARFDARVVAALPDRLRRHQRVFSQTGGLHAAGLFSARGELVVVREDVGRHNAVDKAVGHAILGHHPLPLHDYCLVVSGRVSFEIVQKAAMAGIALIAAVSAPTSLAVSAAQRFGVTLACFVRDGTFNLYAHPERVVDDPPSVVPGQLTEKVTLK
jgi:FdhD protein